MHNFCNKYIKFTIYEIALAGMLLGLFLLFSIIVQINIPGIMQISLSFVFYALFGILFGPIKGVFLSMLGDTLKLAITSGIGQWMWQYEIESIGITWIACLFLCVIKLEGRKWLIINLLTSLLIFVGFFATYFVNWWLDKTHVFSKTIEIVLIIFSIFVLVIYILLFYFYKQNGNDKLKNIITTFTLSSIIIIIFSWIWGPYAFIAYANRFSQGHYSISNYPILLIPRIIKSLFILPIYTILILIVYYVADMNKKYFQKWVKSN